MYKSLQAQTVLTYYYGYKLFIYNFFLEPAKHVIKPLQSPSEIRLDGQRLCLVFFNIYLNNAAFEILQRRCAASIGSVFKVANGGYTLQSTTHSAERSDRELAVHEIIE